jgi:septum site-determining protein MinD
MTRIISIISGKGGVGKTTVGLNIGAALARQFKKNVTLIDCNVTTSHVGLYLGMYYCPITLNKVLRGEFDIKEAVNEHYSGMKVVPASLSISDLEKADITKLRDKIRGLFYKNDIILLDGSPGLGIEGVAAMKASDEILYVTNPFIPSVLDIVRCQEVANEIGVKPLGIVVNMVNRNKYEMTKDEIEELTKIPVISAIPFDKNVHKSLTLKTPVVMLNPYSAASRELYSLASKLIGETYEADGKLLRFLRKLRLR